MVDSLLARDELAMDANRLVNDSARVWMGEDAIPPLDLHVATVVTG
jgi:hypothetical protein